MGWLGCLLGGQGVGGGLRGSESRGRREGCSSGGLPVLQVLLLVWELLAASVGFPEPLAGLGHLDKVLELVPLVLGSRGEACLPAVC